MGERPAGLSPRLGAVAALGGAILLFVSTLLHPLDSDPNAPRAAFAEYAADSLWVWSHLGQFLGSPRWACLWLRWRPPSSPAGRRPGPASA